jgi:hypothetical protein
MALAQAGCCQWLEFRRYWVVGQGPVVGEAFRQEKERTAVGGLGLGVGAEQQGEITHGCGLGRVLLRVHHLFIS